MTKLLSAGTRVRLKVRTVFGWKGYGTLVDDVRPHQEGVRIYKEGKPRDCWNTVDACRHEIAVCRKPYND